MTINATATGVPSGEQFGSGSSSGMVDLAANGVPSPDDKPVSAVMPMVAVGAAPRIGGGTSGVGGLHATGG